MSRKKAISPLPQDYARRKLVLSGRNAAEGILNIQIAEDLRGVLPVVEQEAQDWKLVYSTEQHGISIKTLFSNCSKYKTAMILVIKDTLGSVFGAFLSEPPHLDKHYYGNGHCFLWKKKPASQGVSIFYTTGRNEHFILSQPGASIVSNVD
jgi:TLD